MAEQGRTLTMHMRGADIEQLQQQLRQLGFAIEDKQGYFGKATRQAVLDLQQQQHLEATGKVDHRTATLLIELVQSWTPSAMPVLETTTLAQLTRARATTASLITTALPTNGGGGGDGEPVTTLRIFITSPTSSDLPPGPQSGSPLTISGRIEYQHVNSRSVTVQIANGTSGAATIGAPTGVDVQSAPWTFSGYARRPGLTQITATVNGQDWDETWISSTATVTVNMPDLTPPAMQIIEPANNASIAVPETGKPITIKVRATDFLGIQRVDWRVDGGGLIPMQQDPNDGTIWTATYNAPALPLASHTISVRAMDLAGNQANASVVCFVTDGSVPHYAIIEPPEDKKLFGTQPVTLRASGTTWDPQSGMVGGQAKVEWSVNKTTSFALATQVNGNWANWTANIALPYGFHTVFFRFTDAAGQSVTEQRNVFVSSSYKPEDVDALLSPRGYLEDLLKFARDHVNVSALEVLSTDKLKQVFFQPFGEFAQPEYETAGNRPINSLRVGIEVLRTFLATNPKVMVAHWKCNEGSGTLINDASGNALHGALQGATWTPNGKFGPALSFNGTNAYVQIGADARLKMTNALTMSAWLYPTGPGAGPNGGIMLHKEGEYGIARFPDGTLRWAFANLKPGWNWINTNYIVPTNQWTHLAVTYDNGSVKTYANGRLVHTFIGAGAIGDVDPTLNDLRIGGRQTLSITQYFQGYMDDIALFNQALYADTIRALAAGPISDPSAANLVTAEANYRQAAYEAILLKLGISYAELRLARGAATSVQEALAQRLGITVSDAQGDHLAQLLFQAGTVTEAKLEELFGFLNTIRNPLTQPPDPPQLLTWQENFLKAAWLQQDYPTQPGITPPPPIIDPDMIGIQDLRSTDPQDLAYNLWQQRNTALGNAFNTLKTTREAAATPLAGFDQIVRTTLNLPTITPFLDLATLQQQGNDISAALTSYHLTQEMFSYLLRIRTLASGATGVTASEWTDVYHMLTQVQKLQWAPQWRAAEQAKSLVLSGDYFQISDLPQIPPLWRGAPQDRLAWQDTLQRRMDQKQGLTNALDAVIAAVEELTLPLLRDALVVSIAGPTIADDVADWLSETLLVDMQTSGSQQTTRIGQAIETVQNILFSLRTRRFDLKHPAAAWALRSGITEDHFDREWEWMGSYPTWRAAMSVYGYPENLLGPTLRDNQSQTFKDWIVDLRKMPRLSPQQARDQAKAFVDKIRPVLPNVLPTDFVLTELDMTDAKLLQLRDLTCRIVQVVWVEDGLPPGTTSIPAEDNWNWVSANPAPFAGTQSHQSSLLAGIHQHYFEGASPGLPINAGDTLCTYIYIDPSNPPEEIVLQWKDGSWEHRAYWGANRIPWGTDGTNSRRYIGPLPEFGRWTRLEVPASQVGLEGQVINGMAFALYSGRATWDRAGKTNALLEELFYAVPLQLALQLQKAGEYVAALDWYQLVYAYNLPLDKRKIYNGLMAEESLRMDYNRTDHWTLNQISPHGVAARRANTYTRFTIMTIARCFLEFADSEFARDTSDSLARALQLYFNARDLLALPEVDSPAPPEGMVPFFPPNAVVDALRAKVELQLRKLRTGRNIAGLKRQVQTTTAPGQATTSPVTLGPPGRIAPPATAPHPTPYRYTVLIERSKQLANLAQQIESAYLHALEQFDAATFRIFQADQAVESTNLSVELHALRVKEANRGISLAKRQRERAALQSKTYHDWINAGLNAYENQMLDNYKAIQEAKNWIAGLDATATAAQAFISAASSTWESKVAAYGVAAGLATIAGVKAGFTIAANNAEADLQRNSLYASQARREQEWQLQENLAEQDMLIGDEQIALAQTHVDVAAKEQAIAQTQADQAKKTVAFLSKQFTNADLYDWMSRILGEVYGYFLQQATAMAKLAQSQLGFERGETVPLFVQNDYWQTTDGAADSKPTDRRGLTGSARLLQDIYQLDQFAFDTNKRKLQLSKTLSLAQLLPFEFQQFRRTGVLPFATPIELFDRDFPGCYLRLIKRVRTSVVALVPPTQGIHATLTTTSPASRVIVNNENGFQTISLIREPEFVALTSPTNATGLFEMEPTPSEMLLPFESMGVDTFWEFQLPKASNPIDYRSIADILVTIEYTALASADYRQQVIQRLNPNVHSDRPFSLRNQFPDQWYDLHNPDQTQTPLVVQFNTGIDDFPLNVENLSINALSMYFIWKDGVTPDAITTNLTFTFQGTSTAVGGAATSIDGIISTQKGNAATWKDISFANLAPSGRWELSFTNADSLKEKAVRDHFANEDIKDIIFIVTITGRTPAWPA